MAQSRTAGQRRLISANQLAYFRRTGRRIQYDDIATRRASRPRKPKASTAFERDMTPEQRRALKIAADVALLMAFDSPFPG